MSALAAIRVAPQPGAPERYPNKPPQLRAIEGGRNARVAAVKSPLQAKAPFRFLVLCGLLLTASLVVVLVLNTNVINGAYESAQLQKQIRQVEQDIQVKQEQLRRTRAELPNRAAELGLVPAANAEVLNITPYVARVTQQVVGGATARTMP